MTQSLIQNLIGFTLLAGLLTMLPGIDTAQVLRSVAVGGKRNGYATLLGIMGGVWFWGIAASIGVSAILLASKAAYLVVKLAGAAYLLYLGIKMILDSRKISHETIAEKKAARKTFSKSLLRAFVITLTNPKNGAFYVAILPTFLPQGIPTIIGGFMLSTIHNLLCLAWFTLIIFGAGVAKNQMQQPKVQKLIERISGIALIGFGAKVIVEK